MNLQKLRAYCAALPEAASDVKWGADLCFTIDTKMFAVFPMASEKPGSVCFKCDPERFLELTDQPGIVPAPYLARAHWVLIEDPAALTDTQARALVHRSFELIVGKLSKRRQRELLG